MYAGNTFISTNQECNLWTGKPCNITGVMGKIQFTVMFIFLYPLNIPNNSPTWTTHHPTKKISLYKAQTPP
jgi:hypothetical protein